MAEKINPIEFAKKAAADAGVDLDAWNKQFEQPEEPEKDEKQEALLDELKTTAVSEKDKKIAEFFGKETRGVITEEPPLPKGLTTSEKKQEYIDTQQSDYEKAAGIKPESRKNKEDRIKKEKEEEQEKASERFKEAEMQVEETRRLFMEKDIEAEKNSSKFWKLFRIGSLGQYGQEHQDAKSRYEEALRKHKDEFLKTYGINKESVAKLVKFLDIEEQANLDIARRNVKTDNGKASWPVKVWNGYLGFIERYWKIGQNDKSKWKKYSKKVVASMFVAIGAAGAAYAGGAVAGAIVGGTAAVSAGATAGAWLVRSITVDASSIGFKKLYEGGSHLRRSRKSAKEAEEIIKHSKTEGAGEMQLDLVNASLDEKIKSVDAIMQEQKQWKRIRTFAAVGTAALISEAGRHFGGPILKKITHWFSGAGTENVTGLEHSGLEHPKGPHMSSVYNDSKVGHYSTPSDGHAVSGTESYLQTAGKGDSVWKMAENQLNSHYHDQFTNLDPARKTYIIDAIKDKIAADPAKFGLTDPDKIALGQKINFHEIFRNDSDVTKIFESAKHLNGDQLAHINESLHGKITEVAQIGAVEKVGDAGDYVSFGPPEHIVHETGAAIDTASQHVAERSADVATNATNPEIPSFDHVHSSVFGHNIDNYLSGTERELFNAQRGYGGNYGPAASPVSGPGPGSAWFENVVSNRNFFSAFRDQIAAGKTGAATKAFQSAIAPEGSWNNIKSMTFGEAAKSMDWKASEKIESLFKDVKAIFGDSVKPHVWPRAETMGEWTKRVTDIAFEQTNKPY